jgi:hypothetical protein
MMTDNYLKMLHERQESHSISMKYVHTLDFKLNTQTCGQRKGKRKLTLRGKHIILITLAEEQLTSSSGASASKKPHISIVNCCKGSSITASKQ